MTDIVQTQKGEQMKKLILIPLIALLMLSGLYGGDGKISGKVYFDYTIDPETNENEFALHRVYFTYGKNVNDAISVKFRTDMTQLDYIKSVDFDATDADGSQTPLVTYVKYAYLSWKTKAGKLSFGLQGLNMFPIQEANWGYRYIEKSLMDKNKFSSSADLGISMANHLGDKLNYSLMISNGSGYKKAESDKYKKISAQIYMGETKLTSKSGFNAGAVFSYEPNDADNTSVAGLFGAWANSTLRIGSEFAVKIDDATTTLSTIYGNFALKKAIHLFARADIEAKDDETETYVIVGASLNPVKGLKMSPNIKMDLADESTLLGINMEFAF